MEVEEVEFSDAVRYALYAVAILLNYFDYSYSVKNLMEVEEANPVARAIGR